MFTLNNLAFSELLTNTSHLVMCWIITVNRCIQYYSTV